MTKEELAQELNGREYRMEITREEAKEAKSNNLVVVFGASDDLMEFRGAIDDETDAYEGVTVSIDKNGLLENQCDNDECPYFADRTAKAAKIKAVWCPHGKDLSWEYYTEIPHATFYVMDKDKSHFYCRGIVFSMGDVK
jgi:Rad3-related DNA helicase